MLAATAPAQAASPLFRVDPFWPKPLPNNWILGQVSGIATDQYDRIWIVQRPASLTARERAAEQIPPEAKCCVAAPPVLIFSASFCGADESVAYFLATSLNAGPTSFLSTA